MSNLACARPSIGAPIRVPDVLIVGPDQKSVAFPVDRVDPESHPITVRVVPIRTGGSVPGFARIQGDEIIVDLLPGFRGCFQIELTQATEQGIARTLIPVYAQGDCCELPFVEKLDASTPLLGYPWIELVGRFHRRPRSITATGDVLSLAVLEGIEAHDVDILCQVRSASDGSIGIVARQNGDGFWNAYFARLLKLKHRGQVAEIGRFQDGNLITLHRQSVQKSEATLRFEVVHSRLRLWCDEELVGEVIDSSLRDAGRIGILGRLGSLHRFEARNAFPYARHLIGEVVQAPPAPATGMETSTNGSLGDDWEILEGTCLAQQNLIRVTANQPFVALRRNIAAEDVHLRAQIAVPTKLGSRIGLIARRQGMGLQNAYIGVVVNRADVITAEVHCIQRGKRTVLSSCQVREKEGELALIIIGNSLRLYYCGRLTASLADERIRGAGAVGFEGLAASLQNFSVATERPALGIVGPEIAESASTSAGTIQQTLRKPRHYDEMVDDLSGFSTESLEFPLTIHQPVESARPRLPSVTHPAMSPHKLRTITAVKDDLLGAIRATWQSRRLLPYLWNATVALRTKETVLGHFWLLLRPVVPALAFALVVGNVLDIPTDGAPYPLVYFIGWSLWSLFASAIVFATRSLRFHRNFLKFSDSPYSLAVAASIGPPIIEFAIVACFLPLMALFFFQTTGNWYLTLHVRLLWVPFLMLTTIMLAIGISFFLAILNTRARDVRLCLPYALQAWMLVTPIIYPVSALPEPWRTAVLFNPMCQPIEGFRWALLGTGEFHPGLAIMSFLCCLAIYAAGLRFLFKIESEDRKLIDELPGGEGDEMVEE